MSGVISKSPDMNSGIVGVYPANHIVKASVLWVAATAYTNTNAAFKTDGEGVTWTTSALTRSIMVSLMFTAELKDLSGADQYPTCAFKMSFHSDSTTAGATPSGADLMPSQNLGAWVDNNATTRMDVYFAGTMALGNATVSPSTSYSIQLVTMMNGTASNQCITINRRGIILEMA